ncbi:MAG: hypothetical protein CL878_09235 [Dehalococcoidia bacterium]|nr:hypothetical protein [Dehalococcoidia bacterium]
MTTAEKSTDRKGYRLAIAAGTIGCGLIGALAGSLLVVILAKVLPQLIKMMSSRMRQRMGTPSADL